MTTPVISSSPRFRRRNPTKWRRIIQGVVLVLIVLLINSLFLSMDERQTKKVSSIKIGKRKSSSIPSYENHSRIAILNRDDFRRWPGSGTIGDPYIIEGLKIVELGFCVYISSTSVHFIIRDCYLESSAISERTVLFEDVTNGKIMNCTIIDSVNGIEIINSANSTMMNCTIIDCDFGVSLDNASNITLTGNRIFRNTRGISVENSTDCTFIFNSVYRNVMFGVRLFYSTNNCSIYSNRFGWNEGTSSLSLRWNAIDDGESNLWDDNVSKGNYWSDLAPGSPYQINGTAYSLDRFPSLLSDIAEPLLSHPEDISYDEDELGNSIVWNCSDEFPCFYYIIQDGARIQEQTWNGSIISYNVDNLITGTYNYTLVLSDAIHTVSDSVIVRVYLDILSGIAPELLIMSSLLSVLFVALVLLIVKQIK
jgi:parallel beta-helix repeat protein